MVKSFPQGKSLPFSSVEMATKVVTNNFQVYLYDEMNSNSTHVNQGKNKACDQTGLASKCRVMEFTRDQYQVSLFPEKIVKYNVLALLFW